MTLKDIEAASVSSLRKKKAFFISRSVSLSLLGCLIRYEIYWPAFHSTDFLTPHWEGVGHFHGISLPLYVKRRGGVDSGTRTSGPGWQNMT